ncbi:MAG: PKD domain-containing protein, partial [Gammaproteobacteria bacterium]
TYLWNFGDGSMTSTEPIPSHTFTAPVATPTSFPVVLTVTDVSNATAQATLLISVNNTPPSIAITSPTNGMRYPLTSETSYALTATISDAEHGPGQLACEWQTILHHNQHTHADPVDTNCATTTVISPVGCDGESYFYSLLLKVTDGAGLATTQEVRLYPDCPEPPPVLKYLGRDGTGAIRWQLTGDSARTYLVEGSTNLVGWSPVTTVQPTSGTAEFNDANAGALQFRFYRAVLVP